jgi:hypothetical protein
VGHLRAPQGGTLAQRTVGIPFSDLDNLNLALVEAGLAEVYRGFPITDPYHPQYAAAEAAAHRPVAACGPSAHTTRVPAPTGAGWASAPHVERGNARPDLDQLADAEHTCQAKVIREAIELLLTRLKRP